MQKIEPWEMEEMREDLQRMKRIFEKQSEILAVYRDCKKIRKVPLEIQQIIVAQFLKENDLYDFYKEQLINWEGFQE